MRNRGPSKEIKHVLKVNWPLLWSGVRTRSPGPSSGSSWKLQKCQGRLRFKPPGWEGGNLRWELALPEQSPRSRAQALLRLSLHWRKPDPAAAMFPKAHRVACWGPRGPGQLWTDSVWRGWKEMAEAGCLWQGEAFRGRWPATHVTEELEEPCLPHPRATSLCRELGASSSF